MEEELKQMIIAARDAILGGEVSVEDAIAETFSDDALANITRDEYTEAVGEMLPPEMHDAYQDNLDAAEPGAEGIRSSLEYLFQNEEISNHINNAITVEGDGAADHYGDDHYGQDEGGVRDIHQANTTTNANATGDAAVAGDDLSHAQVVTGDGANVVGDYNSGVNFGDNSGQVAGGNANAGDFVGDGSVNNGEYASINDSAFGLGDDSKVTNTANDSYDASTNDSYNETDSGNTTTSYTEDNVGNTDYQADYSLDGDLKVDLGNEYSDGHDDHGHHDHGHDDHHEDHAAD